MFLFIYLAHITGFTLMLFKYISCSYLSFFPALSCCIFRSLNTSHVLIYLILDKNGSVAGRLFKYISCSYLSQIHSDFRTSILLFKYISCSYLSMYQNSCSSVRHRLNTSHVLIYRQRSWVLSAQYQV